jgi:outer membrane protein TolC
MKAIALIFVASGILSAQWLSQYRAPYMPPADLADSPRAQDLLRAGNLYLSLTDAIALAVENNLDVEYERYAPRIAATDLQRAKGGGALRGILLTVAEVPPGIGGPASPLLNVAASGMLQGTSVPSNIAVLVAIQPGQSGIDITGAVPLSIGPPVPQYDPVLTASLIWQHQRTPELNVVSSGSPVLAGSSLTSSLGVTQGFSPGTQLSATFNSLSQSTTSRSNRLNPNVASNLGLSLVQPLLRGFPPNVNRRFIRIARNNEKTSDLLFRQQAIATVSGVVRLYMDLVSLGEDVRVKEQTLAVAQRLYADTRVQVEQGTLAPVELTRALAQVAAAEQDLANSRGYELQQELIVKNQLTKGRNATPGLRDARVLPTTPIDIPEKEPVRPVEDLVAEAYRDRPEIGEARLQIQNAHIALEGSRNELLPQLDIVANAQNTGLAGQANPLATTTSVGSGLLPTTPGGIGAGGGFGTDLGQIFTGQFPTYSIGVQLTLPLRNRIAQADVARDEIQIRQWDIRYRQLQNQVRLEVEASVIALAQARAAYDASVQTRALQEQSLAIEMEKYAVGLSTVSLVLQYQSFVAQARSTEVAARNVYVKARVGLDRALGKTLDTYNVTIDEAMRGRMGK